MIISKYESTTSLFVITSCYMSDNCQTIYVNRRFFVIKVCIYKLLMAVFAYNIVILEYSDLIFLDLKQKATVLFSPFSIVM